MCRFRQAEQGRYLPPLTTEAERQNSSDPQSKGGFREGFREGFRDLVRPRARWSAGATQDNGDQHTVMETVVGMALSPQEGEIVREWLVELAREMELLNLRVSALTRVLGEEERRPAEQSPPDR